MGLGVAKPTAMIVTALFALSSVSTSAGATEQLTAQQAFAVALGSASIAELLEHLRILERYVGHQRALYLLRSASLRKHFRAGYPGLIADNR